MPRPSRVLPLVLLLAFGCGGGGGGGSPEPLASYLWSGMGAGNDHVAAATLFPDGSAFVAGRVEKDLALEGLDEVTDLDDANGSLFLARFGRDGRLAWARTDGLGTSVDAKDVAALRDGSCLVTGSFQGTATFGLGDAAETSFASRGGTDVFIAKYAADGALVWAKQAGGSTVANVSRHILGDTVKEIAAFADGSCVIAGMFSTGLRFGEGENTVTLAGGGGYCSFVARYAPDGTLQWAHQVVFTAGAYTHVAARADGSSLVVGLTPGPPPGPAPPDAESPLRLGGFTLRRSQDGWTWMAAIDAAGEVLWLRGEGRDAQVVPWDFAAAKDGSFVVAGEILGSASGIDGAPAVLTPPLDGRKAFLGRFDANGNALWARKDDCVVHNLVALRADGSPIVAGSFWGTGTLDAMAFDRGGNWGSYLAGFGADGRLDAARIEGGPGLNLITFPGTLAVFDDGRIALASNFQGEVVLGEETPDAISLRGRGAWELLFAVYDENAELTRAP